jgi:hypothetical protein
MPTSNWIELNSPFSTLLTSKPLSLSPVLILFSNSFSLTNFVSTFFRRVDFRDLVRNLFSLYKTRIWMQKLDMYGNSIHSSFSSNDPHAAALTPQRIQQSRRDSQRIRDMSSEYFDPQYEEEYYAEYAAPPPPPPPARGNPRGPIYPRGPVVSGNGYHHQHPRAAYPPNQEQYDPRAYVDENLNSDPHLESMNHRDIEKVIRSTKGWSGYEEPSPYPPPPHALPPGATTNSYARRYSSPFPVPQYQPPNQDYYPSHSEDSYLDYPPHHMVFVANAPPPNGSHGSVYPKSSASPPPVHSFDSSSRGGSPKSRSSSLSKSDWTSHPLSSQAQHSSDEGQMYNYQLPPAYNR